MKYYIFILVLIINFIAIQISFAKNQDVEMIKSKIKYGYNQTDISFEYWVNVLKENGNNVSYKIFDGKEIILTIKKIDNMKNKTITTKIQFLYVKPGDEMVLMLYKATSGKDNISVEDIFYYLIEPLDEKFKNEQNHERFIKLKKEFDILLKSTIGSYHGKIQENNFDKYIKGIVELKLEYNSIDFDVNDFRTYINGILLIDGLIIDGRCICDFKENELTVFAQAKNDEKDTKDSYIFKGKIIDNVFTGIIKFIKEKRQYRSTYSTETELEGTFKLIK